MRSFLPAGLAAAVFAASVTAAAAEDAARARPTNLNASISLEQKQRIRAVVFQEQARPRVARVNFALTIGNVVPAEVPVAPVPQELAGAFPDWHGFSYFVIEDQVANQIIILDPRSRTIVAIIT